jgi:hypothetical protein
MQDTSNEKRLRDNDLAVGVPESNNARLFHFELYPS